jgi:hypothetical protein
MISLLIEACRRWPNLITGSLFDEMDSVDISADLTALPTNNGGARLLSESPLVGSSRESDLSSSDLPAGDGSQGEGESCEQDEDEVEEELRDEGDDGVEEEDEMRRARKAARTREEKLQNDLFLLKKLNSAFSLYTDALRTTQSSTEVSGCDLLLRFTNRAI